MARALVNTINRPVNNVIINGNFDFWQRGTSAAAFSTGSYRADRWLCQQSTDGTMTVERSTNVPSASSTLFPATYSMLVTVTGADASIGASQYAFIGYHAEGYDYAPLHNGQNLTLSFWVKSSLTGTFCVVFRNSANDRTLIKEYTVSSANTWERKTITFASDSAGTWLVDNGAGLRLRFALAAGSSIQSSTVGSWQAGNYLASTNQVNLLSSTHTFQLAQVMLHKGTAAAPFCRAGDSIQDELSLCQRYYVKIDPVSTYTLAVGHCGSTTDFRCVLRTPVRMRADPTPTITSAGNYFIRYGDGNTSAVTTISVVGYANNDNQLLLSAAGTAFPSNKAGVLTASAPDYLELSAEL